MLSGILLILVTMLAVLGAYYLTELASQAGAKRKTLKNAVVLLCAQDAEQMWAAVLDARAKLPDAALVVLSPKAAEAQPLEPSMRGVTFASPGTVGAEGVPPSGGAVQRRAAGRVKGQKRVYEWKKL